MKGKDMKNRTQRTHNELRPEYNFDYSKAIRGKYHQRLSKEGVNVVVLEPDIAKAFRDSATVNDVLRSLLELTRSTRRLTKRSSGHAKKSEATHSV
jgi:arginine deiminase